jgi:hypothetical protein
MYRLVMMLTQALTRRANAWVGGGVAALLGLAGIAVILLGLRGRQPGFSRLGALLIAAAVAYVTTQRRRRPPRDDRREPDGRTPGDPRR